MNGVPASFQWLCGGPPTDAEPCPVAVYEKLLTFCSDLTLPPPWDLLPSDPDCRGPIENPEAALAALRKEFSDEALTQARILDRSASAGPRLKPSLCDPAGAVLALRSAASLNPYDLLTSGGCLSRRGAPALAARHDGRYLLSLCQTGTMFATASVREAALLRVLGCVAASIHGLDRLSVRGLHSLQESFGGFSPAMGRLALVGWQLLPLQRAVPLTLAAAASHLAGAQAHLGLDLSGVSVWYPSQSFIENLRFRLRLRDVVCIRQLLREHEHDLRELHLFAGDPGTCKVKAEEPADLAEAQAQLLAEFARDRNERYRSELAGRAQCHYDALLAGGLAIGSGPVDALTSALGGFAPLSVWSIVSSQLMPFSRTVTFVKRIVSPLTVFKVPA
jgi:hypothetical protein